MFQYNKHSATFIDSAKLSDNQNISIVFYEEIDYYKKDSIIIYSICLEIKHKRKHNVTLKQTGTCGLEGLIWAKNKVIEFEEYIKQIHKDRKIKICISWDDNRRRNVYEKGLKKLGYKYEILFNKKYLVKTIMQ